MYRVLQKGLQTRKSHLLNPDPNKIDPTKPENSNMHKYENASVGFGIEFSKAKPEKPEPEQSEPDKPDLCAPILLHMNMVHHD